MPTHRILCADFAATAERLARLGETVVATQQDGPDHLIVRTVRDDKPETRTS